MFYYKWQIITFLTKIPLSPKVAIWPKIHLTQNHIFGKTILLPKIILWAKDYKKFSFLNENHIIEQNWPNIRFMTNTDQKSHVWSKMTFWAVNHILNKNHQNLHFRRNWLKTHFWPKLTFLVQIDQNHISPKMIKKHIFDQNG